MQLGITTTPINTMKDFLISIIMLLVLTVIFSVFGSETEEIKQKQGYVQVPTLVEINSKEGTDIKIDETPEVLSPKTGGFWVENF